MLLMIFSTLLPCAHSAEKAPQSINDLKKLQAKISFVAHKALPATVSLYSIKNGASGSGVVVSKDGLILTAAHVVKGAENMTVIFPNGKQANGKVLGANYTRDSAMVQITDKGSWKHVEIGHSKNLKTGDFVVALGHAGGYDAVRTPPVRFGRIISKAANGFMDTDCALIGGDSGGPLFNLEGKLVGIHSSIGYLPSINNHAGIDGFRKDWDNLKKGETWGRLGASVMVDPDNPVLGIYTAPSKFGGIFVEGVIKGGPAAKAGVHPRDFILKINGESVRNQRKLSAIIFQFKPGDSIQLELLRNNQRIIKKVTLTRRGNL